MRALIVIPIISIIWIPYVIAAGFNLVKAEQLLWEVMMALISWAQ